MSSYEMEKLLERYTGKGFDVQGLSSEFRARKRIYKELREQKRPLAFAGTTIKKVNGGYQLRAGGHWKMIFATDISSKKSGRKVRWARVIDPLYRAGVDDKYVVANPYKKYSSNMLFNLHWRPWSNGDRQAVED